MTLPLPRRRHLVGLITLLALIACKGSEPLEERCSPQDPAFIPSDSNPVIVGSKNASQLYGVCEPTTCNDGTPLSVGGDHDFSLIVPNSDGTGLTVEDDGSGVLSVPAGGTIETEDQVTMMLDCQTTPWARFDGRLRALRPGTARLLVKKDGKLLDTYSFSVASIASMTVERTGDHKTGGDLTKDGLLLPVKYTTLEDANPTAIALARTADDKPLVLSDANVHWSSSDGRVVVVQERIYPAPPDTTGPKVVFRVGTPGHAVVEVSVGPLKENIQVTVVEGPLTDGGAEADADAGVADAG